MNILVSGIASDIGLGVARVLNTWGRFPAIYGIDVHSEHPGEFVVNVCDVAPRAVHEDYVPWLSEYILRHNIRLFIPTSEAEISVLSSLGLNKLSGADFLINSPFTVDRTLDKFKCLKFLYEAGVSVPKNGILGSLNPVEFPVIVKPRSGQGSKGVLRIESNAELMVCELGLVWQQYLQPDDQEYTCPVYRSDKAGTRVLIIKRKLMGGLTGSGVVVRSEQIESYVKLIADALKLNGAFNVQLRLTKNGPLLFEINPRISSTVVFRDKIGFCDTRWWIADLLGEDIGEYIAPKEGIFFYRGSQEYISI